MPLLCTNILFVYSMRLTSVLEIETRYSRYWSLSVLIEVQEVILSSEFALGYNTFTIKYLSLHAVFSFDL